MALDDRIRPSVDTAIEALTSRVSAELHALAEQVIAAATDERESALRTAREAVAAAAAANVRRQVEDAEARGRARERDIEMTALTRLLEGVRSLDGAATLTDVLDALARAAGLEAPRAAVLVMRHDRLLGWKLTGFGANDTQPKAIDLGLTDNSIASQAVRTVRPVTTRESGVQGLAFAHLPAERVGVVVPVLVGGRAVAIVYADNGASDEEGRHTPTAWLEAIEILARHASRCLEALTVQKTTSAAAPRFWVPAARPSATA
jgi:hypothetical protein